MYGHIFCVLGPTRTSWTPWPTWASGCYRNPRTTGKSKGQLDVGGCGAQLSSCSMSLDQRMATYDVGFQLWCLGYFRKAML